jgi:glutaminase
MEDLDDDSPQRCLSPSCSLAGVTTSRGAIEVKSPIQEYLERLHARYAELRDGAVATYIPELAKANPEWFGICVATTDGHIYEVGDTQQHFTIQSISKPFTYGLALEDRGRDAVLTKIGVEPTGDAFNSISLAPGTGCPLNPMINAGAIAATSLVAGHSPDDKLSRLLGVYSLYAGRPLSLDHAVYESEQATGHRNRAIGHMLRNFDILSEDPESALNLYFRQCSVSVDCRDLSIMAATLANSGVNPLTEERAVRSEFVEDILSIMTTCGMYDYAGQWVYSVGMPAKSGVAGGILVVLPGQLGIGVFSPRLDSRGNSVRGVQVCTDLSRDLQLHFLRVARSSRSAIRAQYSIAGVRSKRRRPEREGTILREIGDCVRVYELQGDFLLPAIEAVVRTIVDHSDVLDVAVLDLTRATQIAEPAAQILLDLLQSLQERDKQLVLVPGQEHSRFLRFFEEQNAAMGSPLRMVMFADLDAALEWCETRLIARRGDGWASPTPVALAEHEFCRGLDRQALAHLEGLLERRRFGPGEYIVRKGDPAEEIYLLMSGEVSVVVALADGRLKRLSTLSAGMTFGELAIVDRTARSADVRADKPVECFVLSAAAFDRLGETHPKIKIVLLQNMLRGTHQMVSRLNQEVATLAT